MHRITVARSERTFGPLLASRLLLANTIVAHERALRLCDNVLLANECDIFVARDGEEQTSADLRIPPLHARENSVDDRRPVAGMSLMNQPGHVGSPFSPVQLGTQKFRDATASQGNGADMTGNRNTHSRIQASQYFTELCWQVRECSAHAANVLSI